MIRRAPIAPLALIALLAAAGTASAHVSITDSTAKQSAAGRLTVAVEHGCGAESSSVGSVDRVALSLPAAFGAPSPVAPAGWRATASRSGSAYRVQWTRTTAKTFGGRLVLRAANPAKAGTYAIPVVQYCGTSSIAWIEKAVGGVEPDHPVPTVKIG
jgi:uncharacterized protein YcnI